MTEKENAHDPCFSNYGRCRGFLVEQVGPLQQRILQEFENQVRMYAHMLGHGCLHAHSHMCMYVCLCTCACFICM